MVATLRAGVPAKKKRAINHGSHALDDRLAPGRQRPRRLGTRVLCLHSLRAIFSRLIRERTVQMDRCSKYDIVQHNILAQYIAYSILSFALLYLLSPQQPLS